MFSIIGPKRQDTKLRAKIGGDAKVAEFNAETLSILTTLHKNKASGNFADRNVER